jgi:hypothetical protein
MSITQLHKKRNSVSGQDTNTIQPNTELFDKN